MDGRRNRRSPWDDPYMDLMDRIHEQMRRQMDEMMGAMRELPAGGNVRGFRVEVSPEGEVRRERIGPSDTTDEALVDVREDGERVTVIMEVPGCSREDVGLRVSAEAVNVTANGRAREIALPSRVDPDSAEATFNNGVLTLRLARVGPSEWRQVDLG